MEDTISTPSTSLSQKPKPLNIEPTNQTLNEPQDESSLNDINMEAIQSIEGFLEHVDPEVTAESHELNKDECSTETSALDRYIKDQRQHLFQNIIIWMKKKARGVYEQVS